MVMWWRRVPEGEAEEGGEGGESRWGRQIRALGGCWGGKVGEPEELDCEHLTEITLPPGLPDYSTVLGDNKETLAYERAETQTLHTHWGSEGPTGSSSCKLLSRMDRDIRVDCLYPRVPLYYIRCVSRGRNTSDVPVGSPKPSLPLTLLRFQSNQPRARIIRTFSSNFPLDLCFMSWLGCRSWSRSTRHRSTRVESQNDPGLMRTPRKD